MSFSEDENSGNITPGNMEQENKVDIEEASVNLAYVKKELYEAELGFQYKIGLNFENIFGESSIEQRNNQDNLIGFLDDEAIMQRTTWSVELEDAKEENTIEQEVDIEETSANLTFVKKELDEAEQRFQYKIALNFQNIFGESSTEQRNNRDSLIGFLDDDVIMETTTESVELEDVKEKRTIGEEIDIEEASVNLAYVKREFEDAEQRFQYKISLNFENIFGESSTEQRNNRDSLIGFLDDEAIMQRPTWIVKLEDVEEEKTIEQSHCNKCLGNYEGYCLNCSSLSHILNNLIPNLNPEHVLNTTPINIFEIREVSNKQAVFVLKTLPKGIILGPFDGITPIESTTGLQWKIKDRKFANDQNGNWMKYIKSVANRALKNLDIFQLDGILYFETSREIQEGEELLVCYGVEDVLKSDKGEEFYLAPVNKEKTPTVFACTHCCLGFHLRRCLVEHKSKCPLGAHESSIEDFEIIQCRYCKMWLEKEEYLESHMLHCLEKYNRLSHNTTDFERILEDEVDDIQGYDEMSTASDENSSYFTQTEAIPCKYSNGIDNANKKGYFSEKKRKCSKGSYQTNVKNHLNEHLNTHNDIKSFECDICKKRYLHKGTLNQHIKNTHSNTSEKKFKCSTCSYQTHLKSSLKSHLNTHDNIKSLECDICKKIFSSRSNLNQHIKAKHSNTNEKQYRCSECPYQTNWKTCIKNHQNTHNGIKPFECDICKKRFNQKGYLKMHITNQHSNTSENEQKYSECSYITNHKSSLKLHLNTQSNIKIFECDICKTKFSRKYSLALHLKTQHSNTMDGVYKCSECSYQTNRKGNLKRHLYTHNDNKPFECNICEKRYIERSVLKTHIETKHVNPNEKKYKCSECSYRTKRKDYLKLHLNTHKDIKPFQCHICKKGFSLKVSLKSHIKNNHIITGEKKYKCSECSFRTNHKSGLKFHLNTHNDMEAFECDICKKKFNYKSSLKWHIEHKHLTTNDKEYKCTVCSYKTNYKGSLYQHLSKHSNIKFECDICKKKYCRKSRLKVHIEHAHLNKNKKECKCWECSYQTKRKANLKRHVNTHND